MPVPDVHDPQLWLREPDAELAEFRRSCPVARHPDGRFRATGYVPTFIGEFYALGLIARGEAF